MAETTIEWTWYRRADGRWVRGYTFNPWEGCAKISPACAHCYAAARDDRFHEGKHWGPDSERLFHTDAYWRQPRTKWNREASEAGERRRVFCGSLCDWLEDRGDLLLKRAQLMELICFTPQLDWLLLSKRPENWRKLIEWAYIFHRDSGNQSVATILYLWLNCDAPPQNVWMGTTVENQDYVRRIDALRDVPARLHFISVEPMLGPVKLPAEYLPTIRWAIIGGESGPDARPFYLPDAVDLMADLRRHDVPIFMKQLGAKPIDLDGRRLELRHTKGGDIEEWPAELRIREQPRICA